MIEKKLKGVIMLVNEFPPLPVGGAERQAEQLSRYLVQQGVDVGVLTRHVPGLPWREKKGGFIVYRLPQFGPGKFKTIIFTLSAVMALFWLQHSYGILHAHLTFAPAIAGILAGRLLGKKVIVKFGNSGAFGDVQQSRKTTRGNMRLIFLRRWADVIVILDPTMEREALEAGFPRERVIRMDNGVDSKLFQPVTDKNSAKSLLHLERSIVAVYTGRLTSQKSLSILLQAIQKALQIVPELHLLLVGRGEEEPALRALAEELKLQRNVTFVDAVASVQPFLNAADLFVLPSLAEGISNSLLEAMSCGLACITTSVGGLPEVLEYGQYGLLVPVNDVDEMSTAMIRLATNEYERIDFGKRARQQILNRYDFRVVGKSYIELYKRLQEGM